MIFWIRPLQRGINRLKEEAMCRIDVGFSWRDSDRGLRHGVMLASDGEMCDELYCKLVLGKYR